MAKVLVIGEDEMLLRTRSAIINSNGIETTECHTSNLRGCDIDRKFDVAVLCHSIPKSDRALLSSLLRSKWPDIKLLQVERIAPGVASETSHADQAVGAGNPAELVGAVKELLDGAA